jgi:Na+-translocating ferredoxin:NAD+ oxidoreductase RnfC subunit
VDAQKCFQLIDQMVLAIPEEIKRAQSIEQERDRIIAQAREEGERIRALAQDEAARMADHANIMQLAQSRAVHIEERARQEAARLRIDADTYAIDTLKQLSAEFERLITSAHNGIAKLEHSRAERTGVANFDQLAPPDQS